MAKMSIVYSFKGSRSLLDATQGVEPIKEALLYPIYSESEGMMLISGVDMFSSKCDNQWCFSESSYILAKCELNSPPCIAQE